MAVGCNDGRIVIWDFLTRGIAKIITAHVHPVCSLRYLKNIIFTTNLNCIKKYIYVNVKKKNLTIVGQETVEIYSVLLRTTMFASGTLCPVIANKNINFHRLF